MKSLIEFANEHNPPFKLHPYQEQFYKGFERGKLTVLPHGRTPRFTLNNLAYYLRVAGLMREAVKATRDNITRGTTIHTAMLDHGTVADYTSKRQLPRDPRTLNQKIMDAIDEEVWENSFFGKEWYQGILEMKSRRKEVIGAAVDGVVGRVERGQ